MEMQIQDLVSAIKKEGVDAAHSEAERIIKEAENKAETIISKARSEAETILKKAETEITTIKESAKTSIEHAKRDAMLFFKKSISSEFEKILQTDITKTVKEETLAKLIIAALNDEDASKYAVEISVTSDALKSELAKKINSGLEIRPNPNVRTGFKLIQKDGSGYFDCSDEELEKILLPFFPEITF